MSVIVGISGGVDSSVVLARAKREGREPIACMLVMGGEGFENPSERARERARETTSLIGVPLIEEDVSSAFSERVIEPFASAYAKGVTPNPCSLCNRELKIASLIAVAERLGAKRVQTGHYARVVTCADGARRIARGADPEKDQSYFLARLRPDQVERLELPLGSVSKAEVREEAAALGLPAASTGDSEGICFAADGDYHLAVARLTPAALSPGPIVDEAGRVIGEHAGIATLTVGQRKGLGLSGGPWFVRSIDPETSTVHVVHGRAPRARRLELEDLTLSVSADELCLGDVAVQTHYRTPALPSAIELMGSGRALVTFAERRPLAAPGQSAVLYDGDVVIGEGTIVRVEDDVRMGEEA